MGRDSAAHGAAAEAWVPGLGNPASTRPRKWSSGWSCFP